MAKEKLYMEKVGEGTIYVWDEWLFEQRADMRKVYGHFDGLGNFVRSKNQPVEPEIEEVPPQVPEGAQQGQSAEKTTGASQEELIARVESYQNNSQLEAFCMKTLGISIDTANKELKDVKAQVIAQIKGEPLPNADEFF